jgi:tRNA (mo5U34)-methyltransferase
MIVGTRSVILKVTMDIGQIFQRSNEYKHRLELKKAELSPTEFFWYPYGTLDNFYALERLLTGVNRDILNRVGDGLIVDIGTADGDAAFFLESLGYRVHAADYPPTNYNSCRGIRLLKQALASTVEIGETDLDAQFRLPAERYELALFLGILYHLKNPFLALESLARCSPYAFISTRIARFNVADGAQGKGGVNPQRVDLRNVPVAYLVGPEETNNDSTNYWMFSEAGLRRVLFRTGWNVLDFMTLGNTTGSDPATAAGDERAFCLVQAREPWR